MSWAAYLGLIVFFTLVFTVFYSVAYSVLLGIQDNYRRYYQKAELQWRQLREKKKGSCMSVGGLAFPS